MRNPYKNYTYKILTFLLLFCLSTPLFSQAPNNDCTGAIPFPGNIAVGSCADGTGLLTVDFSQFSDTGLDPTCDFGNDAVAWYTWTAPISTVAGDPHSGILFTDGDGFPNNCGIGLEVLSGDCVNGFTTIGNCLGNFSGTVTGIIQGNSYYFMIWDDGGGLTACDFCLEELPPPPPNNICTNAVSIPVGTLGDCPANATAVNNSSTSNSGLMPSCQAGTFGDIFYTFVVPSSGSVNISTTLINGSTPGVAIYDACTPTIEYYCNNFASSATAVGLPPGATVLLQVYQNTQGTFNLCLEEPPPNDDCTGAVPFIGNITPSSCTDGSGIVTLNFNSFSDTGLDPTCDGGNDAVAWFTWTAPISTVAGDPYPGISFTDGDGFPNNCSIGLEVLSGDCVNGFTTIGNCLGNFSGNVTGLIQGDSYYFMVWDDGVGLTACDFCLEELPPPPPNDVCANAVSIPVGMLGDCPANATVVNNSTTSNSGLIPSCQAGTFGDIFYTFVVPPSGSVNISMTLINGSTPGVAIYDACNPTIEYYCNNFASSATAVGLPPGATVLLQIYQNTQGTFNLCLEEPPPNDDCTGAIPFIGNITPNSCTDGSGIVTLNFSSFSDTGLDPTCDFGNDAVVWFTWTAPVSTVAGDPHPGISFTDGDGFPNNCGIGLEVLSGDCTNGFTTIGTCLANVSGNINGIIQGDSYYFMIWDDDGGLTACDFCLEELPPPAPGDICNTALPFTGNIAQNSCADGTGIVTLDFSQFTDAGLDPTCDGGNDAVVWFTWTAPISTAAGDPHPGILFTDGDGLPNNCGIGLEVYEGLDCASIAPVGNCLSNASGTVTNLIQGNDYYFLLWDDGIGGTTCNFCLEESPPPPSNDICTNAIPIIIGGANSCPINTIAANNSTTSNSGIIPSCAANTTFGDLFYSFTVPPSGNIEISTNTFSGTTPEVAIYDACNPNTEYFCDISVFNEIVTGLPPGATLIMQIWQDVRGIFDFCVEEPPPPPPNDDVSTPTPICGTKILTATNDEATAGPNDQLLVPNPNCYGSIENSIWFTFETDGSGTDVSFDFIPTANCFGTLQIHILSGPIGGPFFTEDCDNSTGPPTSLTLTNPTPNTIYYIFIDGNAGDICEFTLQGSGGIATCCGPDYTLETSCQFGTSNGYFLDLNIQSIGDNPSGYAVAIDGNNQANITSAGNYTYGPFANGSASNLVITGLDDNTCIIDETLIDDCSCDSLALDVGPDLGVCPTESAQLNASLGNVLPGLFLGYTVSATSACPPPVPTSPIGSVFLGDDQISAAIPIPSTSFPNGFEFFENFYTNLYISSNGFISFDSNPGSGCCSGQAIPSTSNPNNLISLFWADLIGNGSITYYESGTDFVIDYNIPHLSGGNNVIGQIILSPDGTIVINCVSCGSNGGLHSSGIENSTGTIGYANPALPNGQTNNAFVGCTTFAPDRQLSGTCNFLGWYTDLNDTANSLISTDTTFAVIPTVTTDYYAIIECPEQVCVDTVTVEVFVCVPDSLFILDPCVCIPERDSDGNFLFADVIQVNAGFSDIWYIEQTNNADGSGPDLGLYDENSTGSNIIPYTIGPNGETFVNGLLDGYDNDADGQIDEGDEGQYHTLTAIHLQDIGYQAMFSSGALADTISNTCYNGFDKVCLGNHLYVLDAPNVPTQNCTYNWYAVENDGSLSLLLSTTDPDAYFDPPTDGKYTVEIICDDGTLTPDCAFPIELINCGNCNQD